MAAIDVVSADDTESGQELASSLLAQAFADDPVIRWVQPDRSTDRAFHRATLRWAHPHGVVDVAMRDGVGVGAAIWDPPGATLSGVETARMAAAFTRVLGSASDASGQDLRERLRDFAQELSEAAHRKGSALRDAVSRGTASQD